MGKLFLYLGRRDKKGIRVIASLKGDKVAPTRLSDLKILKLPASQRSDFEKIIYDNRMMWDAWIESASSYEDLRLKLIGRGYKNVGYSNKPLYKGDNYKTAPVVDTNKLRSSNTMIRRGRN